MRSGWSSVGGKTSTMPPRTANSPRRSTRSTRAYAAPGELAAALDQVDTRVRRAGEPADHVVELDLLSGDEVDRFEVGQALHLRLHDRADGRDDDLGALVAAVDDAAQHGEAAADGVRTRRQALVRERLPGREDRDGLRADERRDGGGQRVGLALGGGDGDRDAGAVAEGGGDERLQGGRGRELGTVGALAQVGDERGEMGLGGDGRGQLGLDHDLSSLRRRR